MNFNRFNIFKGQGKKENFEAGLMIKFFVICVMVFFSSSSLLGRRINIAKYRSSSTELVKCSKDLDIDPEYRKQCIDVLVKKGKKAGKNAVNAMVEVLKDKGNGGLDETGKRYITIRDINSVAREAACYALGAFKDPDGIPALSQSVKADRNIRVRVAAAFNLQFFSQNTAVQGLITALLLETQKEYNASTPLLFAIIKAMGEIGDKEAFVPLLKVTQLYLPDYIKEEAQKSIERIKWDKEESNNSGKDKN